MAKLNSLDDLLVHEMRDIYNAEKQLTTALPRMAKAADSADLRQAFEAHLKETERQIERLERCFELLGVPARGKKCEAMAGLVEEGKSVIEMDGDPVVRDAALIAAAQKVEHYEIASYGCLATYAETLGYDQVKKLLAETLAEEEATDEKLTRLAESHINREAAAPADGE